MILSSLLHVCLTFPSVQLALSLPALLLLCDRERREITGNIPPALSGFCGAHVNSTFYIFGGCSSVGYTNQVSHSGQHISVLFSSSWVQLNVIIMESQSISFALFKPSG